VADGEGSPAGESTPVGESAPLGKSEATGSLGLTGVAGLAGLSSEEAKARLAELGPNLLVERERSARLAQWLRMLADTMALMLAGASVLYMLLGESHEAAVLAAVIVPVLGVDVLMEARSRSALKKLASAVAPRARVVRDGQPVEIPTAELVPGDLLLLRRGRHPACRRNRAARRESHPRRIAIDRRSRAAGQDRASGPRRIRGGREMEVVARPRHKPIWHS